MNTGGSEPELPREAVQAALSKAFSEGSQQPLLDAARLLLETLTERPEWQEMLDRLSEGERAAINDTSAGERAARRRHRQPS